MILEELKELFVQAHKSRLIYSIDQLVRYCRYSEKEVEHSGVKLLKEMLTEGIIDKDLYATLKLAAENFDTPYEITFK